MVRAQSSRSLHSLPQTPDSDCKELEFNYKLGGKNPHKTTITAPAAKLERFPNHLKVVVIGLIDIYLRENSHLSIDYPDIYKA